MKTHVMKFVPFNQALIGKEVLYVFPLPYGPRCLVRTNGTDLEVVNADTTENLTGFVPDLEDHIRRLYSAMFSEPNPKYTRNGEQVVFPFMVFDVILHDRSSTSNDDGSADGVRAALEDWDDIGVPMNAEKAAMTILCAMLDEEFIAGKTVHDLWWQRAWIKRGLVACGLANPYTYPRPPLKWLTQSPRDWAWEGGGIASDLPSENWDMIYNVFRRKYRAALLADVWQGWKVGGGAFRILTEEEVEI
ncbi:hypothetical protein [Salmonella phage SEP13]|nr:hypothetical protein [Salmonella phage STP11]UXR08045.1 hypothetical protein [Salmonella phage SEP13]